MGSHAAISRFCDVAHVCGHSSVLYFIFYDVFP